MVKSLLLVAASLAAAPALAGPVRAFLVTDANPAPVVVDANPDSFYAYGGSMYFAAWRSDVGRELFATDGASATATLIADFSPLSASSNPYVLGRIGGRLIVSTQIVDPWGSANPFRVVALDPATGNHELLAEFAARDNVYTWRIDRVAELGQRVVFSDLTDGTLWSTDGTAAGTGLLFTPDPPDASVSANACTFGNRFVFLGRRTTGLEVWSSDGTEAGTQSVAPIAAGSLTIDEARVGNVCHFLVQRGDLREVWSSDGTAAGTRLSASFNSPISNRLVALNNGAYLLGPRSGRILLYRVGEAQPVVDLSGAWSSDLAVAGDRLAFVRGHNVGVPDPTVVTVSDGTAAGTSTVTLNGAPLELINASTRLAAAGGRFYLRNGDALYVIDPATAIAQHLGAKPLLANYGEFASLGTLALGAAVDGVAGNELWRSDGTAAGTYRLFDLAQATADGVGTSHRFSAVQGDVVFFGNSLYGQNGLTVRLWRTDGTAAGTRTIPDFAASTQNLGALAAFGDGVVFTMSAADGSTQLYRTGADFSGTQLLWNSSALTSFAASSDGRSLTFACRLPGAADNLCGLRDSDLQASVLWAGDQNQPQGLQRIGSTGNAVVLLYHGRLWRSDGTMPGTFELAPDIAISSAREVSGTLPGGLVVFSACPGTDWADCGLYRSDASVVGTRRIATLASDLPRDFAPLGNDRLLFGTDTGALWVTDATAAGTQRIAANVGATYGMASTGSRVHMQTVRVEPIRYGYVVSDGSAAGTRLVMPPDDFAPGNEPPVVLDADTVVFPCYGTEVGYELCRVDANGEGWTIAADIAPGQRSSGPRLVARAGHAVYYSANDGFHGAELWRAEPLVDAIYAGGFE